MTERGERLYASASRQTVELIDLVCTLDDTNMRLPCPGREKLGDGTVAACAQHTAENYRRIASFVATSDRMPGAHEPPQHPGHRMPRFLRGLGHRPPEHAEHDHSTASHDNNDTADDIDLHALREQLSVTHDALWRITELTESQLDAIPPNGSFRFCDGQRTLEEVLVSLLKHQRHQVDALTAATA